MKKLNSKGISPVIATVIIVAVAIAIAIAVAYWVLGIIPAFTRYEELKITNAYISDSNHALIFIKNTGSADVTIIDLLINGKSFTIYDPKANIIVTIENTTHIYNSTGVSISLAPGVSRALTLNMSETFSSGTVYEFIIKTAAGGSYPVTARAP